jgi:alpha-tubulin suppressor-like RCC1 family protein
MTTGAVKCWGDNTSGQLGDGTTTQRTTPVDVGLGGSASILSVKGSHACVLMTSGTVKCWGLNDTGQLGNGSTTNSSTPLPVQALPNGVNAIDAGGNSTCALVSGGSAMCWGANGQGQLGDGTTTNRSIPVKVAGLSGLAAIASGGYLHTCALTSGGGVKCWGYNISGQLGNGTTSAGSSKPVDVKGLASGVQAIATQGAQYSCALLVSGGISCWGANSVGQLGNGTTTDSSVPVEVVGF